MFQRIAASWTTSRRDSTVAALVKAICNRPAAEAALAEFRQSLEDARAAYRKSVGLEPFNMRTPGRLRGLPPSKDQALAVALRHNPTIKAAQSDADAAKYGFDSTAGLFSPTISLE